jgi:exopolyphosphatase/guanosine-5'-triphosphate,3'-diphosphate pyrophosphatase
MNAPIRAVIDVGTNTIKLLVGRSHETGIEVLLECLAEPNVCLGTDFYKSLKLTQQNMRRAAEAIRNLSLLAARYNPASIQVFATSAVRDALNRDEFVTLVRETSGRSLELLPGTTEAEWVFRGVTSDPALCAQRLLVLGFGGGSLAAIVSDSARIHYRSFNLGTVRLREVLHLDDAPTPAVRERCEQFLSLTFKNVILPELNCLLPARNAGFTLVGTGGTATSLAAIRPHAGRLSQSDERSEWLTRSEVSEIANLLWELSPQERCHIPGQSRSRLDVILPGALIVEAAMKGLGFRHMRVSRRGVRYGALLRANESVQSALRSRPPSYLGNYHRVSEQMLRPRA